MKRILGYREWDQAFKFSFVRNPWDKVVSHYAYRLKTNQSGLGDNPISFDAWLRLTYLEQDPRYYDKPMMFMPQVDWLVDERGKIELDFIGRFENLADDFRIVCQKLEVAVELPHLNASGPRGCYRDYYTTETAAIIRQWFIKDIEFFGYEF